MTLYLIFLYHKISIFKDTERKRGSHLTQIYLMDLMLIYNILYDMLYSFGSLSLEQIHILLYDTILNHIMQ